MRACFGLTWRLAASVLLGLPLAALAAEGTVGPNGELGPSRMFIVDTVVGVASIPRRGGPVGLQKGYLIFGGETVNVRDKARLGLILGKYGTLEMGPGALVAEKLPASSSSANLDTRLQLQSGHLHLLWGQPDGVKDWPLTLRFGAWSARIRNGEYFFQLSDSELAVCNAGGEIEVASDAGDSVLAVTEGTCLQLQPGPPNAVSIPAERWNEVRRDQDVDVVMAGAAAAPVIATKVAGEPVEEEVEIVKSADALLDAEPTAAGPEEFDPAPAVRSNVAVIYSQPDAATELTSEWLVNVISVPDAALAERHVKTLVAAGFAASVRAETVHGQSSYRVVVPGIRDGAAASGIAQQLQARFGFRDAWALERR